MSWILIFLSLPALRRLALAHPVARSSHRIPTPQGAGIAMAVATAVAFCLFLLTGEHSPKAIDLHGIALAAALIVTAIIGMLDDIRGLSVVTRLGVQGVAAVAVVATLPASIAVLPPGVPLILERLVEIFGLITLMNLVNFIDGLDEISIGHGAPALAGFAAIAISKGLPDWTMALSAAACGALIGFWPWNRHIAKVFLGDSGSLPLGLLLGYFVIVLAGTGEIPAAILLCLYPLADGLWTLADRFRRRQNLTQSHRDHCYQRATSRGVGVPTISRLVLGLSILLAGLAFIAARSPAWVQVIAVALGFALTAALLRWFAAGWKRP